MIIWDDEEGKRLSYEMKVDSAEQLVHEITAANEEYSKTLSETDAVKKFENTKTKSASQPTFTIPDHISKDKIWNDCWFDEKRNVYVTHNSHFLNNKNRRFFEVQEQYEKETNDIGVAVPVNKIKFFYGFPSVSLYNDETKSSTIWFFLPTIKNEMLTKEIVEARLGVDPAQYSVNYTVETPRTHKFGTGLELNDREYELGKDSNKYLYIPLVNHNKNS